MKKRSLSVFMAVAVSTVFFCAAVYATQVPDAIEMKHAVFGSHKKPIVHFQHKKHNKDYGIACTECHHRYESGKNVWKEGDAVKSCTDCHSEAKAPRGDKSIEKYYYNAIHENCKGCHKDMGKAKKATGPTKCTGCHAK